MDIGNILWVGFEWVMLFVWFSIKIYGFLMEFNSIGKKIIFVIIVGWVYIWFYKCFGFVDY